jgi:hypothetical protein
MPCWGEDIMMLRSSGTTHLKSRKIEVVKLTSLMEELASVELIK